MYVDRDIRERFEDIFKIYNMIAVVGARQAGKTTFLKHQLETRPSTSYALFDDPDVRRLFEEDIKKFEMQYLKGYELTVLDEVHYCKGAGMKLKYLVDTGRKLWITSSSEVILGRDVLAYLVGRVSLLRLFPFSFHEFLRAKEQRALTPEILERCVWEHMMYGGYPRVVTTKEPEMKKTILRDLHETMLLKDVVRVFSIADIGALERCARFLAVGTGDLLSYEHVSNALSLSFQTIKKYLAAMEKSYLIIIVTPFFTNKKKEITKQPRIYFLDTGLRNMIARRFDVEPEGRLFENYILSELVKMGFTPKYWRTKAKAEVDFVIEKDDAIIPVEVKLTANSAKVERSLRSFIDRYEPDMALVVYYKGKEGEKMVKNCKVVFADVADLWNLLKPTGFS